MAGGSYGWNSLVTVLRTRWQRLVRDWPRIKIGLIAFLVALLLYGAGSFAYLASTGPDHARGTVTVGVSSLLVADAERMARVFAAGGDGRRVVLVDGSGAAYFDTDMGDLRALEAGSGMPLGRLSAAEEGAVLAGLLEKGTLDFVLAEGPALELAIKAGTRLETAPMVFAAVLAVPFPGSANGIPLDEARAVLEDARAGDASSVDTGSPVPGLSLISLGQRSASLQPLAVDGIYPTLAGVEEETYPLAFEAGLVTHRPDGLFGLPARIPLVRSWLWARQPVVGEFAGWMATDAARSSFYGLDEEVTLTAVGDVMLGRNVARDIGANGLDWPFGLVGDRLTGADITFCNLEAPLSMQGTPIPNKQIWLRGKPEYVQCLEQAGIDITCLANNHILDYDSPCLLETLEVLDQAGIQHCGGGADIAAARAPAIVEVGNLRVAFLAYTEFADVGLFWSFDYPRSFEAEDDLPGCAPLRMDMVAEDIAQAQSLADLVVVCYHWGLEDIPYPQAFNPANDLEAISRQTIDLGACLVLGTHPHAVQGFEVYHGGLIAYSLGNFVMDQKRDTQKESMILDLILGPEGVVSAHVTPVWIDVTRPRVLEGDEGLWLLEKIEEISTRYPRS